MAHSLLPEQSSEHPVHIYSSIRNKMPRSTNLEGSNHRARGLGKKIYSSVRLEKEKEFYEHFGIKKDTGSYQIPVKRKEKRIICIIFKFPTFPSRKVENRRLRKTLKRLTQRDIACNEIKIKAESPASFRDVYRGKYRSSWTQRPGHMFHFFRSSVLSRFALLTHFRFFALAVPHLYIHQHTHTNG